MALKRMCFLGHALSDISDVSFLHKNFAACVMCNIIADLQKKKKMLDHEKVIFKLLPIET